MLGPALLQMYDFRRSALKLADAKGTPAAKQAATAVFKDIEDLVSHGAARESSCLHGKRDARLSRLQARDSPPDPLSYVSLWSVRTWLPAARRLLCPTPPTRRPWPTRTLSSSPSKHPTNPSG